jgi:hypothetical protein
MCNLKKQLKLMELLKEVLNEIGDLANIKPYAYRYHSDFFEGSFFTDKDEMVRMSLDNLSSFRDEFKLPPVFNPEQNQIYQVSYSVEDSQTQYRKASYKELVAIMKTVVEFCKEAFQDVEESTGGKPIFLIASQSKESQEYAPDPQKDALYKSIILKNLPSAYRTAEIDINGKPTMIIQKK